MKKESDPRIYFGRPVSLYDTPTEKKLMKRIQGCFSPYKLEDPNQKIHQEGYARCKAERPDKDGMPYFLYEVIPKMSAGIFVPFSDGMFGTGVFREAKELWQYTYHIYEIGLDGIIKAADLNPARMLSVEETRKRVHERTFIS